MVNIFFSDISHLSIDCYADFSQNRIEYINSISDNSRKKQSFFVWKLLLNAFSLLNIDTSSGFSDVNGKWKLNNSKIRFSLSHSNNLVAVAISDFNVGVDVELVSDKILKVSRFFSEKPFNCDNLIEFYTKKWVEKESKFKYGINLNCEFLLKKLTLGNEAYYLGVAYNGEINRIDKLNLVKI